MKKLFLGSLLSACLLSTAAMAEQMTGYISDAHCGAAHDKVSEANTKCVEACINKKGAEPVLVSNGKVMKFDADSAAKAKAFAGQEVKIDGTMNGDTVTISSIDKTE